MQSSSSKRASPAMRAHIIKQKRKQAKYDNPNLPLQDIRKTGGIQLFTRTKYELPRGSIMWETEKYIKSIHPIRDKIPRLTSYFFWEIHCMPPGSHNPWSGRFANLNLAPLSRTLFAYIVLPHKLPNLHVRSQNMIRQPAQ